MKLGTKAAPPASTTNVWSVMDAAAGEARKSSAPTLVDAFEQLVESFEEANPVANANAVQMGSVALALVSATAPYLRRLGGLSSRAAPQRPRRTRAGDRAGGASCTGG